MSRRVLTIQPTSSAHAPSTLVHTADDAATWMRIMSQAFGYATFRVCDLVTGQTMLVSVGGAR